MPRLLLTPFSLFKLVLERVLLLLLPLFTLRRLRSLPPNCPPIPDLKFLFLGDAPLARADDGSPLTLLLFASLLPVIPCVTPFYYWVAAD